MLRRIGFWYVLACAVASQALGQDRQPLKETKVLGGTIVETFVPDQPQGPVPDPAFQQPQPQPQTVIPNPVYQQPQLQQQLPSPQVYQHPNGCGCPVCARRILSQRTQERSKTIREIITVTVVEEIHPTRVINVPARNPCCPPYGNRPVFQRQQGGYGNYAYQPRPQGLFTALFGINSGIYLRTNQGYGGGWSQPYAGYGGYPPPYAQSGQNYGGAQPWYGGRQW